jgi:molecular chaperone GrpE
MPEAPDTQNPSASEVSALQAELQAQTSRLDEVLRAYSRLQQDKDDFLRRAEREKERVLQVERGNVGLALLDAVDQLDLSLRTSSSQSSCRDCQALGDGVRLIRDGLLRSVEKSGLTRLKTIGVAFDPLRHEAVEMVPVDDPAQDGRVVTEVRAGYQQGDRILRPARVTVGSWNSAPAFARNN